MLTKSQSPVVVIKFARREQNSHNQIEKWSNMILIENNKYLCIECIRGHRTSQCKHNSRPLLQVRSKGRPNIQNNPSYRIAVFAKKYNEKSESIDVTEFSMKYIIDFKTGDIIGPYTSESSKMFKPDSPKIDNNSFINSASCCGKIGKTSCGCKHGTSKSRILKTYLKTSKKWKFISNNSEAKRESLKDEINKKLTNCECDENCQCEGCLIHNNKFEFNEVFNLPDIPFENQQFQISNIENPLNNTKLDQKKDCCNKMIAQNNQRMMDITHADSLIPHDSFFKTEPGTDFINQEPDLGLKYYQDSIQNELMESINDIKERESDKEDCGCESNNCQCLNCEKHGIINGVKLDDLFSGLDNKIFQNSI